jgi:hypothetical protein
VVGVDVNVRMQEVPSSALSDRTFARDAHGQRTGTRGGIVEGCEVCGMRCAVCGVKA